MNVRLVGAGVGVVALAASAWITVRSGMFEHTEPICDGTPPPEAEELCAVETAIAQARAGDLPAARATCDVRPSRTWKGECHFQVAEALADAGQLAAAFAECDEALDFGRMCYGHALWMLSDTLVAATPTSADAQQQVDQAVAGMPTPKTEGAAASWDVPSIARAAAWHGIYAGSGSTDPTAARSARAEDLRFAISAFAWEATRLLAPKEETASLLAHVSAMWEGAEAPIQGAQQPSRCWDTRMMPRAEMDLPLWLPSVRTFPGNSRFYDEDPATDLVVAALDAAWGHGWPPDVAALEPLRASPSIAMQKTVARHLGMLAVDTPELARFYGDGEGGDDVSKVFRKTRSAARNGQAGRSVVSNRAGACL